MIEGVTSDERVVQMLPAEGWTQLVADLELAGENGEGEWYWQEPLVAWALVENEWGEQRLEGVVAHGDRSPYLARSVALRGSATEWNVYGFVEYRHAAFVAPDDHLRDRMLSLLNTIRKKERK